MYYTVKTLLSKGKSQRKRIIQTLPPMHFHEFELMMEILDDEDIESIRVSGDSIEWSDLLASERYPYNDPPKV